jgi:DNA-binding MarR family transcriptional regulator
MNRARVLATIGERPGISKADLKEAAGLTSAGVAQNLRRLLDRGEIRKEPLPSGQGGYRLVEPGSM